MNLVSLSLRHYSQVGCLDEHTMSRRIHVNGTYSSHYAILETLVFRTASIDVEGRIYEKSEVHLRHEVRRWKWNTC